MKKSSIQHLIDAYHGNAIKGVFDIYKKGFRKRIFGLRTAGIERLESFLKSDAIKAITEDEEITGPALTELLTILTERDERIKNTGRGYEAYPSKSTNRVFQSIYEGLWSDLYFNKNKFTADEITSIEKTVLNREANKFSKQYEKSANEGDLEKAHQLGVAYLSGQKLELGDYQKEKLKQSPLEKLPKLDCSNNQIGGRAIFDNLPAFKKVFNLIFIPSFINFGKNTKLGLKWLEFSSSKGNNNSSMQLAKYYAAASKVANIEESKVDPKKAIKYLQLAATQGNTNAKGFLAAGGQFGKIELPTPKSSISPKPR